MRHNKIQIFYSTNKTFNFRPGHRKFFILFTRKLAILAFKKKIKWEAANLYENILLSSKYWKKLLIQEVGG